MSLHKNLTAKYAGKPILLGVAVIGFSVSCYGLYFQFYKPWAKRRRYAENEEYARYIFEQEQRRQNSVSENYVD
nr:unnamed protein product [Callosobruchus chinensis]